MFNNSYLSSLHWYGGCFHSYSSEYNCGSFMQLFNYIHQYPTWVAEEELTSRGISNHFKG